MDTFHAVAWVMGIALSVSVLTLAASPLLKRVARRQEQRAEAEELNRTQAEYRRQLQEATDRAISAALRAHLAEPVEWVRSDLVRPQPVFVSISDVVARAHEDFAQRVPRGDAEAMLRHRLEFRGHARWLDLITDAFDNEEDQTP